jgi:hypothetical protein
MCTVSWIHDSEGYQLLCNRDEKLTRAAALPPQIRNRDGVRYLAPVDGNFGGAWIGTNEFGVSICLLNGARRSVVETRIGGLRSRGLLLPELLVASTLFEVNERIWRTDLQSYAPFTLAVLEPGQPTSVTEWDGLEKMIVPYGEGYMPLVSSSFDPDGVRTRRREEFRRKVDAAGRLDASLLFMFHGSHGDKRDAYSPCMHRTDARTVSFSWIRVTSESAKFLYVPDSPCQGSPGQSQTIELAR